MADIPTPFNFNKILGVKGDPGPAGPPGATGPQGPPGTGGIPEFNVKDYGAVGDCNPAQFFNSVTNLAAHDNLAAFNAVIAAIAALPVPKARVVIPAGNYYLSGRWLISGVTVEITGEAGDGNTGNFGATVLCFADACAPGGGVVGACVDFDFSTYGSSIKLITVTQFTGEKPSAWQPTGTAGNQVFRTPVEGYYGYVLRGPTTPHAMGSSVPVFPREWDVGSLANRLAIFENNDLIYAMITDSGLGWVNKPIRYKATGIAAQADGEVWGMTGSAVPYTGDAVLWQANHTYAVGAIVRPTDANFVSPGQSHCFQCLSVSSDAHSGGTEPTWVPGTTNVTTTTDNHVVWVDLGKCWPRTGSTTTTEGDITWAIDSTTSVFTDSNGVAWDIQAPYAGIRFSSNIRVENCLIVGIHGDGMQCIASSGSGTGSNGQYTNRVYIQGCAGNGYFERGGDANMGEHHEISVAGCQGWHIFADSFIGSSFYGCQSTPKDFTRKGRGGYRSSGLNAQNQFHGCYMEGGSAPAMMNGKATVYGLIGQWSFTPGSFPRYIDGVGQTQANGGFSILSFGPQSAWAANRKTYVGEVVADGNFRYTVLHSNNGSTATGITGAIKPSFSSHTALSGTFLEGQVTLTASTNATPVVVTSPAHGYATGDTVVITGSTSGLIDGTWVITVLSTTTFSLNSSTAPGGTCSTGTVKNAKGVITWSCTGPYDSTLNLGGIGNDPGLIMQIKFPDITNPLNLLDNAPGAGWIGWSAGSRTNAFFGYNTSTNQILFGNTGNGILVGFGTSSGSGTCRRWTWDSTEPSSVSLGVGAIQWMTGQAVGGYAGRYVTTTASPDTWTKFGKLYDSAKETFDQLEILWTGGNGGSGAKAPTARSKRDNYRSTDGSAHVASSFALIDLQYNDVIAKVIACEKDLSAHTPKVDAASFLLRISTIKNGGTYTSVISPIVLEGEPTDATHCTAGATAWTATIARNAANYEVTVTGQAAKNIDWDIFWERLNGEAVS